MHALWTDIRHAFRVFLKHPGISTIAVLSLGIGLAVTSVIYSLADGMFMRPLPVREPDGLVWVDTVSAEGRQSGLSWLRYLDLRQSAAAFEDVAAQNRRAALLDQDGDQVLVLLTIVSDNYFSLLGIEPARGRLFSSNLDEAMQNEPAIAISDSLWRRRFNADTNLVGSTIRMNERMFTVVGILPPDFRGLVRGVRNDVWVPVSTWKAMGAAAEFAVDGIGQFEPVARLREGKTMEQAQAELDTIVSRWRQENSRTFGGRRLVASTEAMRGAHGGGPSPSAVLLGGVGILVLIACVNVAMLLLAQGEARRREIAIRLATGAGRFRLFRQLLTEGALFAVVSAIIALVAANWLIPLVPALLPPGPHYVGFDIRMDSRVVLATIAVAGLTVLVFALAPALAASRTDFNQVLRGSASLARRRFIGRRSLAVVQAALSVVLIAGAGLLVRSFLHTAGERPGFDTDRNHLVLVVSMNGESPRNAVVAEEILQRVASLPGVKQAAYCRRTPLVGPGSAATIDVVVPGRASATGEEVLRLRYNQVSSAYFDVTGTRIVSGRAFGRADEGEAPVVLVNETLARTYWPGRSAVGEWLRVRNVDRQVVGVVEDSIVAAVHEPPEPFLYLPYAQMPSSDTTFVVETENAPGSLLPAVKSELMKVSAPPALLMTETLEQQVTNALYPDWLPAFLSSLVGVFAVLLAGAGLFGVVLHGVNRQLREIGIRMALGARRANVVGLILGEGLRLALVGVFAGVAVALSGGRLLAARLHGVSPYDPFSIAVAMVVVVVVAAAASLYPAWKATRIDPAGTLRAE